MVAKKDIEIYFFYLLKKSIVIKRSIIKYCVSTEQYLTLGVSITNSVLENLQKTFENSQHENTNSKVDFLRPVLFFF